MYDPGQERPTVPIEEQLAAVADQIRAGKIRHLGVSNETPWGVCEWVRLAEAHRLPRIVSIQNAYNLINRVFEMGLAEVHRHLDVPLLAYSPLGFGHLSGKYLDGARPERARLSLFPPFGQRYAKTNVAEAVAAYVAVAHEAGIRPATLAQAFARSRWFTASMIIGATTLEQLGENLDSAGVELSPDVLAAIDEVHSRFPNPAV